jgi:D-3-phosphoglycerate dehydrogenase
MKPGAILINNARGTVVDLDALAQSLRDGHLAGAAVDVFPVEPASNKERFTTPLQGLPNVILSPHVGGSTEEAQARIGQEVARKLIEYSDTGTTAGAVNFPQVQLPARHSGTRYMHTHRNAPGILTRINDVFARRNLNIAAQFLQTDGDLGYVVVEADDAQVDSEAVLDELRTLPGTVRARLVFER